MLVLIIVVLVVLALVGFVVVGFNKLRRTDIGAQEALGGIDVQLTRRADLIPNLVETVKGYAAHEKGVFEEVTAARAGLAAAAKGDDVPAKAAADAALQQALVRVNAVAENYPDLKANQNFLDLQKQLADTENQISFARQYYNDAVATLNKLVVTIPWMLLVGMAGVKAREFYEAPAGADVAPKVDFGTSAPAAPYSGPAAPVTPAAPGVPPTAPPPATEPPAGASDEPPAQP
jgi:LemA protein